ncbi:hypothetical protein [Nocardioides acrostichi]|uniref:Uncharacterized protein n=1 Tax=Nocardioides acrostichi TaxID=2784339 RepID=A0A930UVM8_9ACTN|nr:hypothetical protein [Nocardioides acrostichi]MBF4161688.1 hypothetical protein [Nocardioides acrostichi]
MARGGARKGSRHAGARPDTGGSQVSRLLGLSLGATALIVAWGYLVLAAIDFGTQARDGRSGAWGFLALAAIGAAACLFIGLMLGLRGLAAARAVRAARQEATAPSSRPAGGKRARR